jgi:hypothetical protein
MHCHNFSTDESGDSKLNGAEGEDDDNHSHRYKLFCLDATQWNNLYLCDTRGWSLLN